MKYVRRLRREWPQDIYDEEFVEELLEDDEIDAAEAGFMHGYMEDEDGWEKLNKKIQKIGGYEINGWLWKMYRLQYYNRR